MRAGQKGPPIFFSTAGGSASRSRTASGTVSTARTKKAGADGPELIGGLLLDVRPRPQLPRPVSA